MLEMVYRRILELKDLLWLYVTKLAGDEGFEPPILGPEPSALPLGQSPIYQF